MTEANPRVQERARRLADAPVHVQKFSVPFEYPVYFTSRVFDPDNEVFAKALCAWEPPERTRFFTVIDSGVANAWPDLPDQISSYARGFEWLQPVSQPAIVPGGERCKDGDAVATRLQRRLRELHLDRHSVVVAIGGGAVLDVVGYAASTAHRGISLVRIPTTVLGQNDAGVGVKNGVNAFGTKNFLGTFAPPLAVINDAQFIATLPARDQRAGMAEAIKVALIRDPGFFACLEEDAERLARSDPDALAHMIRRSAELHLRHISESGDPFERGSARPLDFGHWAAHRLEALSDYRLRHGEAVAIGMALDSWYAFDAGLLPRGDLDRICAVMEAVGLRLWDDALELCEADGRPCLLAGLSDFREHLGGTLTVTLLRGIGRPVEVHEIDEDRVRCAIAWLRDLDLAR